MLPPRSSFSLLHMIRRDVQLADGNPGWVLITQMEHAALARTLADQWPLALRFPPEIVQELLSTVSCHDDGWQAWEAAPQVDPRHGRPFAFTEMPLQVSLDIWQRSIESAAKIGPLPAWLVAGHFIALLGGSHEADQPVAQAWMETFEVQRSNWLAAWRQQSAPQREMENILTIADEALHWLQFFDALSLWFCCAVRTSPWEKTLPQADPFTFSPTGTNAAGESCVALKPWPLAVSEFSFTAAGQQVPARFYEHDAAMQAVEHTPVLLCWRLLPG